MVRIKDLRECLKDNNKLLSEILRGIATPALKRWQFMQDIMD
jgi:hypothetical protein